MTCTLLGLTGHIQPETSELLDQSRSFRYQFWLLQQELEDFGKKIKLEMDRSEQSLLRFLEEEGQ